MYFQYSTLVKTLERFGQHPYAYRQKDFIMKFRHQLAAQTEIQKVPEVEKLLVQKTIAIILIYIVF